MTLKTTFLLLGLGLLAGCTSNTEQQGIEEVSRFYGGSVGYSKGSNVTTAANEPQGKYLEIKLSDAHLGRRFSDLHMPASNCAYLVYSRLTRDERQGYNYLKVTLSDSGTTHGYSFPILELQAATQAAHNLTVCMDDFEQKEYGALTNIFNPQALGSLPPDSLAPALTRVGRKIGPISRYSLEGYDLANVPIKGQPHQFVRLFVAAQQPLPMRKLLFVIDPRLRRTEKFLYGINLLN